MTMRPNSTALDEHADRLTGAASRLALVWEIARDAERMGRPADAELTELRALIREVTEAGQVLQGALAEEPLSPKAGYTARDLRQGR